MQAVSSSGVPAARCRFLASTCPPNCLSVLWWDSLGAMRPVVNALRLDPRGRRCVPLLPRVSWCRDSQVNDIATRTHSAVGERIA